MVTRKQPNSWQQIVFAFKDLGYKVLHEFGYVTVYVNKDRYDFKCNSLAEKYDALKLLETCQNKKATPNKQQS